CTMSKWAVTSRTTAGSARGSILVEACGSPCCRFCTPSSRRGIMSCMPAHSAATRRLCLLLSGCAFARHAGLELIHELRPATPEVVPRERFPLAVALFGQREPVGRECRDQGLIAHDDLALERFVEFCRHPPIYRARAPHRDRYRSLRWIFVRLSHAGYHR